MLDACSIQSFTDSFMLYKLHALITALQACSALLSAEHTVSLTKAALGCALSLLSPSLTPQQNTPVFQSSLLRSDCCWLRSLSCWDGHPHQSFYCNGLRRCIFVAFCFWANPWPELCPGAHSQCQPGGGPWRRACICLGLKRPQWEWTGADLLTHLLILTEFLFISRASKTESVFLLKDQSFGFYCCGKHTSGGGRGEHKLNPNPLDLMGNVWRSISCGLKCVCVRDGSEWIPGSVLCIRSVSFM